MTLARFLTDTAEDIDLAAQTLAAGELLGLPTETVYGLAADALQASAVAQVFQRKGRPADHPLIVHVGETSQVFDFASEVPDFALALMQTFWPGPLTLILPRLLGVAEAAAGGHPTIALRCPSHPLAQKVLQKANVLGVKGVAAPSANLFGRVSPTTALHVREAFAHLMVIDGGSCQVGIESAIVDASQGGDLLDRVRQLRRKLALELGVVIPLVRTRDNLDLPAGTYSIKVHGVELGRGESPSGHVLVLGFIETNATRPFLENDRIGGVIRQDHARDDRADALPVGARHGSYGRVRHIGMA